MKSCNRGILLSAVLIFVGCDTPSSDDGRPDAAETAQAVTCSSGCTVPAVPPNGAPESSGFFWTVTGSGQVVWSGGAWDITLPVNAGDVVSSVSIVVRDNGGVTPNRVTARLQAQTASGIVQVGAISSDMSGNTQTLVMSLPTAHVVAADERLYVQAIPWTAAQQIAVLNSMVGNVVVGAIPPSQLSSQKTIPLAINAPRVGPGPGFQGDALYMSGPVQTEVFQITGVPVGAKLTGARVRVRDSATGPTQLNAAIFPSTDGNQGPSIATSATSNGSGLPQTLSLSGLATTITPLTTYSIYVSMTTGSALVSVVGIDVDYQP